MLRRQRRPEPNADPPVSTPRRRPRRRTAIIIAATSAIALITGAAGTVAALAEEPAEPAQPAESEPAELVFNGTFDNGSSGWYSYGVDAAEVVDGEFCVDVPANLANPWDAGIGQNDIQLIEGAAYTLSFTASVEPAATVRVAVQLGVDPWTSSFAADVELGAKQTYTYTFTGATTSPGGQLAFQVGGNAEAYTLCVDDVSLLGPPPQQTVEQVKNGTFDAGTAGWFTYGTSSPEIVDGQLCVDVPAGLANPWDAGVGQNNVPLVEGSQYVFSFDASAVASGNVRANVQLGAEPWTSFVAQEVALTPEVQHFSYTFTASESTDLAQIAFHVGANPDAYTFCLDNVSLLGGEVQPPYEPDTGPRVRVNQVGYLTYGPKNATIVTEATEPLSWQLVNAEGTVVAEGVSTPRGVDISSGENVHTVDFSAYQTDGSGFTLVADGETSYPFAISGTIYDQLRSDALQFFYIQRSGIAIDGSLVGEEYARPAGHVGVAPNQGDTEVPCQPGVCDYTLDVSGGWYDAGDHGKYVVNGGIATYQLLSTFERTKYAATADPGELSDSTLRVPERGNNVPDVLDEARWELEFLMKMQVPAGEELAGMVHHKIHDRAWTGLPLAPEADPQPRELHPPSTAATLNMAAAAAVGARLFAPYDSAFAARALTAAETAYAAAKAHPDLYADPADGDGGGTYSDSDVSDEFYWAAAELFITTGKDTYRADVLASPHHTGDVFKATGFGWPDTAALGRLDLATVPNLLPESDIDRVRASVLAAADMYLESLQSQAYARPMPEGPGGYYWGANSNLLNNAAVMAIAFDLTGDVKYRDGALQAVDYIFGRNALNHSFVTGWGTKTPQNQHSRIYGHQIDESLPHPPAGSLAGGPSASLEDPFAAQLLAGCAPAFCYVDDIQSYSTNEVAINWNASLAWIASFLADQDDAAPPAPVTCDVDYLIHATWPGGFNTQVIIKNTGTVPINGWELRWSFLGGQTFRDIWSTDATQTGATVSAKNAGWNATIQPGQQVTFGFIGVQPGGPNPVPNLFLLNGAQCS